MKVKKFEGQTEQTVIEQVQRELGPKATIVSIKNIRNRGFFGFLKKPRVEVTAAYEEELSNKPEEISAPENVPESSALKENQAFAAGLKEIYKDRLLEEQAEQIKQLEKNVLNAQEMLARMNAKIALPQSVSAQDTRYKNPLVDSFYKLFLEQGVIDYVAAAMLEGLDFEEVQDSNEINDREIDIGTIVKLIYGKIISIIGKPNVAYEKRDKSQEESNALSEMAAVTIGAVTEETLEDNSAAGIIMEKEPQGSNTRNRNRKKKHQPKEPFIAAFIGPTGVGKTTTIAKLSADFVLNKSAKLGLISADTYRIAAVEQLRTYADILDVSLSVVYGPDDLSGQLSELRSAKDVVLIDTAGRSHRHGENMSELKELLDAAPKCHKYLVLSLTTKFEDMLEIAETFSKIADFNIIFTKMDETKTLGSVLNLCYHTGKTVSYITFGQNVPNDIKVLRPEDIARAILCGIQLDSLT